jgi:hypothetical protein
MTDGIIPYGETGSGWSGSDTSRERQEREDGAGITGWRQHEVFAYLTKRGADGATVAEVEDHFEIGHGKASSALTHLHRADRIKRMKERRNGQEVYILEQFRGEREEAAYRPRLPRKHPRYLTRDQVLAAMMDASVDDSMYEDVRAVLENLP